VRDPDVPVSVARVRNLVALALRNRRQRIQRSQNAVWDGNERFVCGDGLRAKCCAEHVQLEGGLRRVELRLATGWCRLVSPERRGAANLGTGLTRANAASFPPLGSAAKRSSGQRDERNLVGYTSRHTRHCIRGAIGIVTRVPGSGLVGTHALAPGC
jgi:hypothetical protein